MTAPRRADQALDLACGYCGAVESRHLYSTTTADGTDFWFRNCRACDATFLAPRPTPEELAASYDVEYYGTTARKFIAPIERVIDAFRSARARRVARALPSAGRVLDIGCGNGGFLAGIAERGFAAHGIELPGGSAERAQKVADISVYIGALEDGHFADQRFDAITLWHVFEHLVEPRKTLEIATELLNPGGRLYLSMPNVDSWQCRIFKGNWLHHDPPRHLFYLGPEALRNEVERLGLRQESRSFFSFEQNPFGIAQSLLNCVQPERDVLYEALKGNPAVTARHGRRRIAAQKALFLAGFPLCAALAGLESAAGRGGTMELVFVKTTPPETEISA